jgi:hypothetical protein
MPDGFVYTGEWLDGEIHGIGTATYANGDRYEGAFDKGKRQGKGKLTYAGGEVAEGEWLAGVLVAPPETAPEPAAPAD